MDDAEQRTPRRLCLTPRLRLQPSVSSLNDLNGLTGLEELEGLQLAGAGNRGSPIMVREIGSSLPSNIRLALASGGLLSASTATPRGALFPA